MKIPFAGGHYATFSKNINPQECINWFTHIDNQGATSREVLRATPGLKVWLDTGEYAEVRGIKKMGVYLYVVVGNKVFRISTGKTKTQCSGTLDTSTGAVSMDTNGIQLAIVDGLKGYCITAANIAAVTDADFPNNPQTVTYIDGYFVVNKEGSGRAYRSDTNDFTSWNGTNYFNAEGDPDNTLSVLADHRDLIMFGGDTIDFWGTTSINTVGFARKPGLYQEVGIGAKNSPAQINNTVCFLTNKHQVAKFEGGQVVPLSPRSVDYQIAQYLKKDDAIGMGVTIQGEAFYILAFPTANKTWAYHFESGLFNLLSSYPNPIDVNRWRGNCQEYFDGKTIIGDFQNGILYEWDFETLTDNDEEIRRRRIPPTVQKEGKRIKWWTLRIFFEPGVGADAGAQGEDPQVCLELSKDGGHTWGNEIWRSAGKIGKTRTRAMWKRLGATENGVLRVTVTDPVKWVITHATLEAELDDTT